MSGVVKVTHRGWFGLCPVYFGELEGPAPLILERHWLLTPLMVVSEAFFTLSFFVLSILGRPAEGWPLRVTGELDEPFDFQIPEDQP